MGRHPLSDTTSTKPTLVRLTEDIRSRITALVGPNRMAQFIREAVEKEIRSRERKEKKPAP